MDRLDPRTVGGFKWIETDCHGRGFVISRARACTIVTRAEYMWYTGDGGRCWLELQGDEETRALVGIWAAADVQMVWYATKQYI